MSPKKISREYERQTRINTRSKQEKLYLATQPLDDSVNTKSVSRKNKKKVTIPNLTLESQNISSKLDTDTLIKNNSICTERKSRVTKEQKQQEHSNVIKTPEKPVVTNTFLDGQHSLGSKQTNSRIAVARTPRRSTKTPKKSPKYLSSPKRHSSTAEQLSKTPRKLSLTMESPNSSREDSAHKNTDLHKKSRVGNGKIRNSTEMSRVGDSPRVSTSIKKKNKSLSVSLRHSIQRLSKSPKIVLRSPKGKAKSKVRPKSRQLSLSKLEISPSRYNISSAKSSCSRDLETSLTNKSDVQTSGSPLNLLKKSTSKLGSIELKTPVVLLERLSNINSMQTPTSARTMSEISSGLQNSNLRIPATARHKRSVDVTDTNTPVMSLRSADKTSSPPLITSTPHDVLKTPSTSNKKRSYTLENSAKSLQNLSLIGETENENNVIEAESEPSFCITIDRTPQLIASTRRSLRPNISEHDESKQAKRNTTYELLEPKTPNLRDRVSRKRTIDNGGFSEQELKKNFKVRFAGHDANADSPAQKSKRTPPTRLSTPYNKNRGGQLSVSTNKLNVRSKTSLKSPITFTRTKLNSITNGPGGLAVSRMTGKSNSFTHVKVNVSTPPSFSTSRKKPDSIFSSTKKAPNFLEIHKKMFAKAESVVDAKKRLQERHTAFTARKLNLSKSSGSMKQAPVQQRANEPTNGPYNRFGFRLRKKEATDCIMKKVGLKSRNTVQQQRTILKGVRMNRRFELQMKSRKIDT